MVNVDLYSAIITKVSNALRTLISGEKPGFFRPCLKDSILIVLSVINGRSRQLNVDRRKYCQLTDDGRQFITVCPSQADTDETAESIELLYCLMLSWPC